MSTEPFRLERPALPQDVESQLDQLKIEKEFRTLQYNAKETQAYLAAVREKVKDVEGFWSWALTSHHNLKEFTTSSSDQHALSFLTDIELIQDTVDPRPYELIFHFKENPYFSNTTLPKKYTLPEGSKAIAADGKVSREDLEFEGDLKAKSTKIEWKSEEKNLCAKQPRQTIENGDDDEAFEGDHGSFFWYFATDDEDAFAISNIIQDDVLPNIYAYFTGEANEDDPEDGFDDEDDELDEEDDDDEGSVDLEDEEDQPKKKKQRV